MQPEAHHHAAARALSHGDPLAALNAVAADESAHGRALRGIALAQLQEFQAARRELLAAAEAFQDSPLYRARALGALAEVAAALRELGTAPDALAAAADELEATGDGRNAAWCRCVRARVLLLLGDVEAARGELERTACVARGDPVLDAARELARSALSVRVLSGEEALLALDRALGILSRADHPLLAAEIDGHREALAQPLARLRVGQAAVELALPALARVFRGAELPLAGAPPGARRWLVVDSIARRLGFSGEDFVDCASREVPMAVAEALARAWPGTRTSDELIADIWDGPPNDASHRDRLRVELGRLRKLLPPGAGVEALGGAWRLVVGEGELVAQVELLEQSSALGVLLADGSAWAARDLALAIGAGPRTVQRALASLAERGGARSVGRARRQRWITADEPQGIASQMFLVSLLRPAEVRSVPRAAPPAGERRADSTNT